MDDLLTQLECYLRDTLGITPAFTPWEEGHLIPFFLRERYNFLRARILDLPCLFMVVKTEQEEPPTTIRKHIDHLQIKWEGPVVYLRERITAYNRKRLVEQKIPFIVPGNQMYLPDLGVDFREHFRKPRPDKRGMSPSAQAVLIHLLLRETEDLSPTVLAAKLGYSVMTMSRALDSLEATGIGTSSATGRGRSRRLHLVHSKREVWQEMQPLLRNPVGRSHTIHAVRDGNCLGPQAGLSALAHYSMLSEPQHAAVALSRKDWKSLRQRDEVKPAMPHETGSMIVEVWSYTPTLFAQDGLVDLLSLYLSLRDMEDERVLAALDQAMGDLPW